MARRALEIGAAVGMAQQRGMVVGMVTFTMRHHSGQALRELWDALGHSWGRVASGKHWAADKGLAGLAGYLRVVEVTFGRNGWHVHVHALVFLKAGAESRTLDRLGQSMWGRWSAGLRSKGLADPLREAQDWHILDGPADADMGAYLAKAVDQGIGVELTSSQTKDGRRIFSTRPVWSLLTEVLEDGCADAARRWHEWEFASKGRRQIAWSQGLRELLGLWAEETDEEVAAQEMGTSDDDIAWITAEGWRRMVRRPELMPRLLQAVELDGLRGLRLFADAHGIDYLT